jgi:hypothetical protein
MPFQYPVSPALDPEEANVMIEILCGVAPSFGKRTQSTMCLIKDRIPLSHKGYRAGILPLSSHISSRVSKSGVTTRGPCDSPRFNSCLELSNGWRALNIPMEI